MAFMVEIQHILRTLSSRCRKRNLVNLQGHRASLGVESTVRICSLGDSGDLHTRLLYSFHAHDQAAKANHAWQGKGKGVMSDELSQ